MAKKRYRVVAEDSVVAGHKTGEEFEADLEKLGVNEQALLASGAVIEVKAKSPKEA